MSKDIDFKSFKKGMNDPVSVDLNGLKGTPTPYEGAKTNLCKKGSYLLIIRNDTDKTIKIGKIGNRFFKEGFYVYVGSGMNNLEKRIKRHLKKDKIKHWHIDYITTLMKVTKIYGFRGKKRIESKIAYRLSLICDDYIKGFGSSDTKDKSHLFFFKDNPQKRESIIDIVLDFETFT